MYIAYKSIASGIGAERRDKGGALFHITCRLVIIENLTKSDGYTVSVQDHSVSKQSLGC